MNSKNESSTNESAAIGIDESLARLALSNDHSNSTAAVAETPNLDPKLSQGAEVSTVSTEVPDSPETLESNTAEDLVAQVDAGKAQPKDSTADTEDTVDDLLPSTDDDGYTPNSLDDPTTTLEIDDDLLLALRSLDAGDAHLDFGDVFLESSDSADDEELERLVAQGHDQELLEFAVDTTIFDPLSEKEQVEEELNRIDEAETLAHELGNLSLSNRQLDEIFDGPQEGYYDDDEPSGLDPLAPLPWYMLCRPCNPDQQVQTDEQYLQRSLRTMAEQAAHVLDDDSDDDKADEHFQEFVVSRRPTAVAAALAFTRSFGTGIYQPVEDGTAPKNERTCLGHKETVYGLQFSECGRYLVTAGQDATICVWDATKNSLLTTLKGHDTSFECLRATWASSDWAGVLFPSTSADEKSPPSLIASGGADGAVKLWTSTDPSRRGSWSCAGTLDHSSWKTKTATNDDGEQDQDVPQIYVLQFVDHWEGLASQQGANRFLMTSSDDYIHLWEVKLTPDTSTADSGDDKVQFEEVLSLRFKSTMDFNSGVSITHVTASGLDWTNSGHQSPSSPVDRPSDTTGFGGARNPENLIFVFDASYCQENGLLGVALSDGTLRLVNGRGVCVAILALPGGSHSHLTAFAWDSTGRRLASCVATGHVILWNLDNVDGRGHVMASCAAVLEGGHHPGRPLFGVKYCGVDHEDLVMSWGVDGRLCLWDSESQGQIHAPISTLASRPDYPIYAVDMSKGNSSASVGCVGVVGGREGGFLGLPFYLYNVDKFDNSDGGDE